MRRRLRDNGLSIAFLTIFLLALAGQSLVGLAYTNEPVSYTHLTLPTILLV